MPVRRVRTPVSGGNELMSPCVYGWSGSEATFAEVPPLLGNFLGFLRSDNSGHGHLPYEGERKVVQITWLESEADVERKKRANALAQTLKGLFGKRAEM